MNPFTVGVAHGIVGLPLFSRIGFRVVLWTAMTTVTIIFLSRCAARVKANPGISLMRDFDLKRETMAPGEEDIRLFHGRPRDSQNPRGEMGPLAPAAAYPLAGLGHGRGDHRPSPSSGAVLKNGEARLTAQPATGAPGTVLAVEPPASVVQSRALAPVLVLVVPVFRHPWTALEEADGFDAEGVTGASRILADAFKSERICSGIRPEVE